MSWQKVYQRRVTWPGEGLEDWSAYDGPIYIGRIERDKTTHTKRDWFMWSGGAAQHDGFKTRLMPHQGWEKEHWQAAKAVEDWYDEMRRRNGLPVADRQSRR